jgi:hypothetical protein
MMINIGVFKCVRLNLPDEYIEQHQADAESIAEVIQNYLRFYFEAETINVRGFAWRFEGRMDPSPINYVAEFTHKQALLGFIDSGACGDFVPNAYHAIGSYANYCGLAYPGYMWSVRYGHNQCGTKVDIHEILHSVWSLAHAGMISIDGTTTSEYGDATAIMGATGVYFPIGINGPHLHQLGLIDVCRVTESQTVSLAPAELSYHALRENEYNGAMVGNLFLSHRKVRGHRFALPESAEGRIYLHRFAKQKNRTERYRPDLLPGETVTIEGNKIEYLDYTRETATLRITK